MEEEQTGIRGLKWWQWALLIPAGGAAMMIVIGVTIGNTPEGKERAHSRQVIEYCWEQQGRKSLDPPTARWAAKACEALEDEFRRKWNLRP